MPSSAPATPATTRSPTIKWRRGRAVMLRRFRHEDVPSQRSGQAVQADQVSIVGRIEDTVAEQCHAAIRALGRVGRDGEAGGARPRVPPDFLSAARVERVDLVGAGDVHHAVGHQRSGLQSEIGHGIHPLRRQILHVLLVDLIERAVPVAVHVAVVGGPLPGLGMQDLIDRGAAHVLAGSGERARGQSAQTAEEREQVALFLGGGFERRHGRGLVAAVISYSPSASRISRPSSVCNCDRMQRLLAREAADRAAVPQARR